MKKIVGIMAAAAVLATSVFAADVNAKVKLDGSLFKYNEKKAMSAVEIEHASDQSWNPVVAMSTNGDVAGAEVSFYAGSYVTNGGWNKAYAIGAKTYKIWFSPVEGLRINLGNVGTNLNQEMIDWSSTASGCDSEGYGLAYNSGAIGIDLILCPGWGNNWMSKADGADVAIGDTYFKFTYNGGDIGTINAMLYAKETFKDLTFGAGYKNNFNGITVFENVLGFYKDKFYKVRSETYAQGNADALTWQVWLPVDINLGDKTTVNVGTTAKLSYRLDGVTPYIYFKADDFVNPSFDKTDFEIKPGVTGNVGAMGWEVAVDMHVNYKWDDWSTGSKVPSVADFFLNVPVTFTVNF